MQLLLRERKGPIAFHHPGAGKSRSLVVEFQCQLGVGHLITHVYRIGRVISDDGCLRGLSIKGKGAAGWPGTQCRAAGGGVIEGCVPVCSRKGQRKTRILAGAVGTLPGYGLNHPGAAQLLQLNVRNGRCGIAAASTTGVYHQNGNRCHRCQTFHPFHVFVLC